MTLISNKIHYIGTNDRKKHLFENNWPLPYGVSYNSYLIADEHPALVDTLEYGSDPDYLTNIATILEGRPLEYLIINHLEPDHSSMIGEILRTYPDVTVVGNCTTFKLLANYYAVPQEQKLEVMDGSTLSLGHHVLTFAWVPWVHWPETMVTYDTTDKVLFSCDAFGGFGTLDGGIFDDEIDFDKFYLTEMRRYYSNIVGKWSDKVQGAFQKLGGLEIKIICPSHGPIWRENPGKVLSLYNRWSTHQAEKGVVIIYASMYGNTEKMADKIARALAQEGVKNIRVFDVSKTHVSYLINEIWEYNGLILGTCAYNGQMHPMMHHLVHEISVANPKNKVVGVFGSSSWNGAGVKTLKKELEAIKITPTEKSVELFGVTTDDKLQGVKEFAADFASRL
ncbi:MAG: FprA family A-type flavoprotein [Bacteroidales bacterium]|nr:FprA family A-type flavoprotein [Bacteroidales bacterium]MBR2298385.1 FprA family A-type flavoprotein [Bacteroidales bacterium]